MRATPLLLVVLGCGPTAAPVRTPAPDPEPTAKPEPVDPSSTPTCALQQLDSPEQVASVLQSAYVPTQRMTAKFRAEITSTAGKKRHVDGKVWIAKPRKMRWDVYAHKRIAGRPKMAVTRSVISDGTYLYLVDLDAQQAIEHDLHADLLSVAVAFLDGTSNLSVDFDAALDTSGEYGDDEHVVLTLTPKSTTRPYVHLSLVVHASTCTIEQSVFLDAAGNVERFRFYEPDFEKPVKDRWFKFSPTAAPTFQIIPLQTPPPPAVPAPIF